MDWTYHDDGPAGGNGTPSDLETITVYITSAGLQQSTTATIVNIAPSGDEEDFSLANSVPLGGREWWVFGEVADAPQWGDDLDITIDWGDGSEPTELINQASPAIFDAPHNFAPTGQTYTVTVTARDDDTGVWQWSDSVPMHLLDIDNDADGSGVINEDDEPIDHAIPGAELYVNSDDDNENETADFDPTDEGPITNENDLAEFRLAFEPATRTDIDNYDGYFVALLAPTSGNVWEGDDKTGPVTFDIETTMGWAKAWEVGVETPPAALYFEATQAGTIGLTLALFDPEWFPVDGDSIIFTALAPQDVDLDIFNGQFGFRVPELKEEDVGAFTVANLNDTDGDELDDLWDQDVIAMR